MLTGFDPLNSDVGDSMGTIQRQHPIATSAGEGALLSDETKKTQTWRLEPKRNAQRTVKSFVRQKG